jgi:hypothetical protein
MTLKICACAILISCGVSATDNLYDCLKYETVVRLFWNDDVMAVRDTVLTALSIKKTVQGNYRVIGTHGGAIYCDGWRPVK